jgi:hypothetical protein
MSNNLSTITIPDDCYAVILDAIQRAIIDKCASTATRKAAFSALLALVDAGVVGGTSINSRARGASATAPTRAKTTFFTARATPPCGATTSSLEATR